MPDVLAFVAADGTLVRDSVGGTELSPARDTDEALCFHDSVDISQKIKIISVRL